MMRYFLGVFLVFWATLVASETVDVRSGEHDGFTRLVFTLPGANTKWSVSGGIGSMSSGLAPMRLNTRRQRSLIVFLERALPL